MLLEAKQAALFKQNLNTWMEKINRDAYVIASGKKCRRSFEQIEI